MLLIHVTHTEGHTMVLNPALIALMRPTIHEEIEEGETVIKMHGVLLPLIVKETLHQVLSQIPEG